MRVVQLAKVSNDEMVSVLRCLLCKAMDGELKGGLMCLENCDGTEEAVFIGRYKADPAHAVNASLRLSMRMAQLQNEGEL